MNLFVLLSIGFFSLNNFSDADKPCLARQYNHTSNVCVCNEIYCDEISKIQTLSKGRYVAYYTSQKGLRFSKISGQMTNNIPRPNLVESLRDFYRHFTSRRGPDAEIVINRNKTFQTIMGFGGSFSDSAAINYLALSETVRKRFIRSYFGESGIEYNMGRVPIGGSDFSTTAYAYNMEPVDDLQLSNFSLSMEDYKYKIPMIKDAQKAVTEELHLMASAWSPPVWMKSNKKFGGISRLLKKYYKTWSNYHLRFLEEYDKMNITFWSITTGNEPSNGIANFIEINSLGWSADEQAKWIANYFGPTIRRSKYSDILIVALDDHRHCLPHCLTMLAQNKKAFDYIDGIAVHWYFDQVFPVNLVEITHNLYPNKFIINTESCIGVIPWITEKVKLGSWSGAETYAMSMIKNFNRWYTGWIDWNLDLDRVGGPNWYGNHVDAMVIVLAEKNEFLKQPSFYAMGHFSKFVPRGSIRVSSQTYKGNLDHVAFLRPDGGVAVIVCNPFESRKTLQIREKQRGAMQIDVPERSILTVVYW